MTKSVTYANGKEFFVVDGEVYVIDKELTKKIGDYVFNKTTNTPDRIVATSEVLKYPLQEENICGLEGAIHYNHPVIFATTNPTLNLPLLVFPDRDEEIEKMADIAVKDKVALYPNDYINRKEEWINGFKANPAKWTDEDLKKAYEAGYTRAYNLAYCEFSNSDCLTPFPTKESYLQSLRPAIESFEIEFYEGIEFMQDGVTFDKIVWQPILTLEGHIEVKNVIWK